MGFNLSDKDFPISKPTEIYGSSVSVAKEENPHS